MWSELHSRLRLSHTHLVHLHARLFIVVAEAQDDYAVLQAQHNVRRGCLCTRYCAAAARASSDRMAWSTAQPLCRWVRR